MNIKYLLKNINEQINYNKERNIFYDGTEILLKPTSEFKTYIIDNIESISLYIHNKGYMELILNKTVNFVIKKLYEINQFINIKKKDMENFKKIYNETIIDICNLYTSDKVNFNNSVNKIFNEHYIKLKNFIIDTNGRDLFRSYKYFKHTPLIINSDYSFEFQMELLNLDINSITAPVLDIGCGINYNLVKYLRRNNIQAYGIDRTVKKARYVKKTDWLDFPFNKKEWGTIIAHISFSNHLMHHYVKKTRSIKRYMEKFYEIINSLKINGFFIYTPCLPFIENELINNISFQLTRKEVIYNDKALNYVVKVIKIK